MDPFPAAVLVSSLDEGARCAGDGAVRPVGGRIPCGDEPAMRRIILLQAMRAAFPSLSHSLMARTFPRRGDDPQNSSPGGVLCRPSAKTTWEPKE